MNSHAQVASFAEWRQAARNFIAAGKAPHEIDWREEGEEPGLFASDAELQQGQAPPGALQVTRELVSLLKTASCYRAPDRWAFLYRVLWRWSQGDRVVLSAADEDGMRLQTMVKTVHREEHRMHAFLRFRERPQDAGDPRFVAWFEPEHDVLHDAAEHFSRRMGRTTWLIATPRGNASWDGSRLHFGPPGNTRVEHGDDIGEALWLAYYRSTFNPARLNTDAMEMHMPVRYWKNLPESRLIPDLVSKASAGGQRIAQAREVGRRDGAVIAIEAADAQPRRDEPTSLDQCRRCELWERATQGVPGSGPTDARIMLVGEQPGDQEDLAGHAFVGPAGKLLDDVFAQAGLQRDTVYLTNAVKHFRWEPRGKRRLHKTPDQRHINACNYWLEQEIGGIGPSVIVALGATALKSLMHTSKVTLNSMLGKPMQHEGRWLVTTYHPSYVLRVPDEQLRAAAFADMVRALQTAQRLASGEALEPT
ncbi:UdgX family uracil-DNA binding protein [Noviherbaspirillum aerium]|uniref:UdgX family uracil-DNA binding protein n=1 Tax=Noviherbaspirillum aerium TaxID=2588497 RepID=UPI00124D0C92|nr:UdgX family uracil-DNA binding protein [Noviherbaspirillum aerium]